MTRPPFIDPTQSTEEIFHDRRSKRNVASAPAGTDRRSRQQFDAIPWWLKVNYSKAQEPKSAQTEDTSKKANK
jgi:hypothetical protein